MRKIHKILDEPPKSMQMSPVECGVKYPTVTTDNWPDVTCLRCKEKQGIFKEQAPPELEEIKNEMV